VGWKSYHDQWLSEGFAQFSGNLYVQYRQSEKDMVNQLRKDKELVLSKDRKNRVYESVGPIWMGTRLASSEAPDDYSVIVYKKGGLVVNTIRRLLWNSRAANPDEAFSAMLKDYCRTYDNRPASTEDFKALLERYMVPGMDVEGNHRMDWFFRQYVYGTGIPEYQIQWQAEAADGGQFRINGKVIQSGVPSGWLDALPLYVQVSGKTQRIGLIGIKAAETPFEIAMPFKPDKLMLNYLEDTFAVIK
jgi:aminopeptidase N